MDNKFGEGALILTARQMADTLASLAIKIEDNTLPRESYRHVSMRYRDSANTIRKLCDAVDRANRMTENNQTMLKYIYDVRKVLEAN